MPQEHTGATSEHRVIPIPEAEADGVGEGRQLVTRNVYLDTNIFIGGRFGFEGTAFLRLLELAKVEETTVYSTQILVREVYANIKEAARTAANAAKQFRQGAALLSESKFPLFEGLFSRVDQEQVENHIRERFDGYMAEVGAETVSIQSVSVETLFDDYFAGVPPFDEERTSKKSEFPDATVIAALDRWCSEEREKMYVVSADEGFRSAAKRTETLIPLRSLDEYLDLVTAHEQPFAGVIRRWLHAHWQAVENEIAENFAGGGFYVDEAEGYVNGVVVEDVHLLRVSLVDVSEISATVRMRAIVTFLADLSYTDPESGIYDSEDKVMVMQDEVEASIREEVDVDFELRVDFPDLDNELDPSSLGFDEVERELIINSGRDISVSIDSEVVHEWRDSWQDEPVEDWWSSHEEEERPDLEEHEKQRASFESNEEEPSF